jgi:pimeloyl-ACP methyl ester carboxylesterase
VTYGEPVTSARLLAHSRQRTRARAATVALALLAALLPVGVAQASTPGRGPSTTSADTPTELAAFYTQTLAWTPCEGGLQCTWLTVPLDYANPAGPTIQLRVNKVPAKGPAASRQGSIVVNPGGPGGSGLDLSAYVAESIAPKVNQQFDIVGFDPRGVGKSAPITCVTGRQTTVWLASDGTPDTSAEEARMMRMSRAISNGCLNRSPNLAAHVGTDDSVRDMDILRQALGDSKLNWLGFSYGTQLGAMYTEFFPDNVGRFVLDGPVDPSLDGMQMSRGQSRGFQVALGRFAADCVTRSDCTARTKAGVLRGINRLLERLDTTPMLAGDKQVLTQAYATEAILYSMYSPLIWPSLRVALQQAAQDNGRGLMAIADYSNARTGPNTYATNVTSAFYAINCWDDPATPGAAGLRAAAKAWSRKAKVPEAARALSWGNAPCSVWFGHSPRPLAPVSTTTTAPIVIVGTLYDPATPYPWALALHQQMPTSTLLTWNGDGHTAYGMGSKCIDSALETYLLTGAPPAPGIVCT